MERPQDLLRHHVQLARSLRTRARLWHKGERFLVTGVSRGKYTLVSLAILDGCIFGVRRQDFHVVSRPPTPIGQELYDRVFEVLREAGDAGALFRNILPEHHSTAASLKGPVRQVLQRLRRKGLVEFDRSTSSWRLASRA